ncbi:MAG: tryptophan-rich sensory protein [Gammaproteobacteria bacterium]
MRSVRDWGGNIAAYVFVIALNGLANSLPVGGQTTGSVSAKYPSLFTPAGFTFSIWGLIYLSLLVFVIWQSLPAQRNNQRLSQVSTPFQLNAVLNGVWIIAWHYEFIFVSLLLMLGILITLVQIFRTLEPSDSLFLRFPFSLYTGWITVATIANISALQTGMEWNDLLFTAVQWTWLKLAVAGAIGAVVITSTRNVVYVAVIAWAAFGIYSKQGATPEVAGAAVTLSILALLLITYTLISRRNA